MSVFVVVLLFVCLFGLCVMCWLFVVALCLFVRLVLFVCVRCVVVCV